MSEASPRKRFSFVALLKTALALCLLAWVAGRLDWTDQLEYAATPGNPIAASGTLEGNWRGEAVSFRFDGEEPLGAPWPVQAQAAQASGAALAVTRASTDEVGYRWRPGMPRVFLQLRGRGLVMAFACLIAGLLFGVTRWWRILHLADCPTGWGTTLRLAFLGLFFNLVMPGLTGGDLPKAVLAVRKHPERRAAALATVVIDRMVGLWAMILLATAVIWCIGGDFEPLLWPSAGVALLVTGGMAFVFFPGPRRLLGLDRLLGKLPQGQRLKRLEQSATLFHGKPGELLGAVALSLGNHIAVIGSVFAIGRAFGDQMSFGSYVGIVPVANLISAVPISPSGWGVGEAAFEQLFLMMGATGAIGVAVSLTYRLCIVFLGLLGGLTLLFPGGAEVRREAMEINESSDPSS